MRPPLRLTGAPGESSIERTKRDLAITAPDVELIPIEQAFRTVWSASPEFLRPMLAGH
jgi:hypothetical protein